MLCPKCQTPLEEGATLCLTCGEIIAKPTAAKKRSPLMWIIPVTAIVVILAVLAVLFLPKLLAPKDDVFAFYIKGGEVMMMNITNGTTRQLTTNQGGNSSQLHLSKDGERLFYLDEATNSYDQILYTVETADFDAQPQQLATGVSLFEISKDGNTVLYITKNDKTGKGDLYLHDLTSATLLAESVCDYGFTQNDELPYYAQNAADPRYYVPGSNAWQSLTEEEFEEQTGGERELFYAFDGECQWEYRSLIIDGKIIDDDDVQTYHVFSESTLSDRILYFAGATPYVAGRPLRINLYVKGEDPIVIDDTLDRCSATFATDEESVIYVDNYNTDTKTGDLILYRDGTYTTIDTEVENVVNLCYIEKLSRDIIPHSVLFE